MCGENKVKVFKLLLQNEGENSNLSLQIDPVENGSGNPAPVFHYGPWRAHTRPHRVARIAARARVHRTDEHEPCLFYFGYHV
jgi:hypothetical protein